MPGAGSPHASAYAVAVSDDLPFETASWGRRMLALLVDWLACLLVVSLFVPVFGTPGGPSGFYTLGVFVVESAVLTCTVGGSFGKLACRLRVIRADGGGHLDPLRS